jgi:signal transduction histidine kinase
MTPSDRQWLGLLLHELSSPLALIGSEAELAIAEALEELEHAYGPGPAFEAVAARLLARLDRLREAREVVGGVLQSASLMAAEPIAEAVNLTLTPIKLARLASQAVEQVRSASPHLDVRLLIPDDGIVVTCDAALMQVCLTNIMKSSAKYIEPAGHLEVRLERQADAAVVSVTAMVRFPCPAPGSLRESLPHLVTKQIVDLHQGSLEQVDGKPHVTRLRLPFGGAGTATQPLARPAR